MVKRTQRSAGPARATNRAALSLVRAPSAQQEEVSRIIRLTPLLRALEPDQTEPFLMSLEAWAALATVVLASSTTLCWALWLLERWELR